MDKDKLPEQGKTFKPQADKAQAEPKAPETGPLSPGAHSETAKVDEKIKAGTMLISAITPRGIEPLPGDRVNPRPTRIYRAKTGKWEYMHIAGNPGPQQVGMPDYRSMDLAQLSAACEAKGLDIECRDGVWMIKELEGLHAVDGGDDDASSPDKVEPA